MLNDADSAIRKLGAERASKGSYLFKSLLDSGAKLAFGSDWPVRIFITEFSTEIPEPFLCTPMNSLKILRLVFINTSSIMESACFRLQILILWEALLQQ